MANRNIYDEEIDFAVLALQSPAFNKYLKPNGQLDFSNPEAVQQLTKSLLERDFGVKIELPSNRLCPPVPNRLNYILWIQDLLDTTSNNYSDVYNPDRNVVGLDIGTGASCIYPLLGCSERPNWRFIATEIDEQNLEFARRNILVNKLKSRIRPLAAKPHDSLIPLDPLNLESIDFTMCNPPFYSSTKDFLDSAASKSRPPRSACTGADVEMVTPGGEIAFVSRIIEESKILLERCQWYTSMLGKYSSIEVIIENLKAAGVDNWAVKDLVRGTKTRRWAVAWSWRSMRPSQAVARGTSTLPKHLLPFPCESNFLIQEATIMSCAERLNQILQALDIRWQYRAAIATGVGFAKGNVWSRAARRKQQQQASQSSSDAIQDHNMDDGDEEPAFVFKVCLQQDSANNVEVKLRWLQGKDSILFESFSGMLKRQMSAS